VQFNFENLITRRQSANNLDDTAKEEDDGIQVVTDVSKDRVMEREYTKIITLPDYPAVNKYMA